LPLFTRCPLSSAARAMDIRGILSGLGVEPLIGILRAVKFSVSLVSIGKGILRGLGYVSAGAPCAAMATPHWPLHTACLVLHGQKRHRLHLSWRTCHYLLSVPRLHRQGYCGHGYASSALTHRIRLVRPEASCASLSAYVPSSTQLSLVYIGRGIAATVTPRRPYTPR